MLRLNPRTNLLEQDYYTYELKDVAQAELFRDIFDYHSVPKIPFNHRRVPMMTPEELWITDSTFRDGQQSLPPFKVDHIVRLYDLMHRLGGPRGLIRQCEFFLYSDRDKEAVRRCLERGYQYPEVTGWIRANPGDFELVRQMDLRETGILTSASDYHIFMKLKKTRRQVMDMYLGVVKEALSYGIRPRCHLEDITRADFYGFVVPFVQELEKLSEEAGVPIKVRACDTLGYGVPYPGAALPRCVPGIIYGLMHHAKVPSERIEWHGHNDLHKAFINTTFAWLYGACGANGTLLGIGERTGNAPIEALVLEYMAITGREEGIDTTAITEIGEFMEHEMRIPIPHRYPLAGRDFNVTSAGVHADGMLKDEEVYNVFNTTLLLKRPMGVAVTDKTGAAGVLWWVKTHLDTESKGMPDKKHPGVVQMLAAIQQEYDRGRVSAMSDEELYELAAKHLPEYPPLERET